MLCGSLLAIKYVFSYFRVGRMRSGWKKEENNDNSSEDVDQEIQKALTSARVWMEIGPAENKINGDFVQVGQPTLLAIKSTLPGTLPYLLVLKF